MKNLLRILVVRRVGLVAAVVGVGLVLASGALAQPHQRDIIVNGKTVTIRQSTGAEAEDVDRVHDTLVAAFNGSTTMRDIITKDVLILVHEDDPVSEYDEIVSIGVAELGGATVWVDVGDIDMVFAYLEGFELDDSPFIVAGGFLTEVLAHEIEHTKGTADPQTDTENKVLQELNLGYQRESYGVCRLADYRTVVPLSVGADTGDFNYHDLYADRAGVGFIDLMCAGEGGGAVGGIAELPQESELQPTASESPSANHGVRAGIAAGAAIGAITLFGAAWYTRRRRGG